MELCEGGSLKKLVHSNNIISMETFRDWGKQIADGMSYLHLKNIIHRDLKPAKYV